MNTTELLNIKASDYALTDDRVEELKAPFIPLADEYMTYIPKLEKVLAKQEVTEELVKDAKRLKLDIAKVRTATKKIKDAEKKSVLQVWNAIQTCHNVIVKEIEEQEEKLDKIVKHFENLEIERKKELRVERISLLLPFNVENVEEIELGEMDQVVFEAFLKNAEVQYKEKLEAQAKEIARLEAEKVENAKLKEENERLKGIEDEKNAELEKERQTSRDKQNELDRIEAENTELEQKVAREEKSIQEDKEKLEKETKYLNWKKENNGTYDIELKEEGKMVLYKKVSEFKI